MRFLIIISFALILCGGCNQGGTSGSSNTTVSPGGYEYTLFKKGDGKTISPNDIITYELDQYVDSTLIVSTRKFGRSQQMQIPAKGEVLGKEQDILAGSRVGDSLRTSIKMDTMKQKPPGYEKGDYIHLDFVIKNAQTKEEIEAEQEAKRKAGEVKEKEVADIVAPILAAYKGGSLEGLQTHESGMKYVVHEPGDGKRPESGKIVEVNYYGLLTDGTMFDNSFGRGESFKFALGQGQVIKGWDVGIPLVKEGGKATLFIPYEMAYGEAGRPPSIPAKSELVFYVEVISAAE